jgi:hypothetical protein
MADTTLEPEGSIEIAAERNGIPATVTMYFVFGGDWANMYDDGPETEEEARAWFVQEVQAALEARRVEARNGNQTERPSDTENRGA